MYLNVNDFKHIRLLINGVNVKNIENMFETVVTLSYNNKLFQDKATIVKSRNNKLKAIVESTFLL